MLFLENEKLNKGHSSITWSLNAVISYQNTASAENIFCWNKVGIKEEDDTEEDDTEEDDIEEDDTEEASVYWHSSV
jgi:hypothetical protein